MSFARMLLLAILAICSFPGFACAQWFGTGEQSASDVDAAADGGFGAGEVGTSVFGGSLFGGQQQTDVWGAPQGNQSPFATSSFNNSFCNDCVSIWDELTFFAGLDGSKQPQDFGVNANLGAQFHVNWGIPVWQDYGVGVQIGTSLIATENAVQVFDLLGEATSRTQSYTTIGMYQRTQGGFAYGFVYDFLNETSYDTFSLGQWRLRASYDWGPCDQFGITANISSFSDTGFVGGLIPVTLRPISQGTAYWRHYWETGAQTAFWIGLAEGHGENNLVTGPAPDQDEVIVIGADVLAPLTDHLALYGETNLMMPADTGTVDAFLGIQWFPAGGAKQARRGRFAPLLPMAAPTSFSVDLQP
ncbi:DUF6666 family protein [Anatilimnocola sp. NA78]|uniref:DUF6666 family protein n=1 Tax=Anatilimnocola sp. NA78 TaxID=3415683 RepID=UPI003CE4E72F